MLQSVTKRNRALLNNSRRSLNNALLIVCKKVLLKVTKHYDKIFALLKKCLMVIERKYTLQNVTEHLVYLCITESN